MERRLSVVYGNVTEEEMAAAVDLAHVEAEARGRGLAPLRLSDSDVVLLHRSGVPALEVERVEGWRHGSLESMLMDGSSLSGPRLTFREVPRRFRLVPYGSGDRRRQRPVPPGQVPPGWPWETPPPSEAPDAWAPPWVEPLFHLRRSSFIGAGALTWSVRRGAGDPEWAEAFQAVYALALDGGGPQVEPVLTFLRGHMEAAGYCFECGVRRTRTWLAESGWDPCSSPECRRRRVA